MTPRTRLHIAPGLSLPLDFATKTAAILAQRRKGKTYTASVLAEEMVAAQQPFVALDPTGAWWGLRAGADGTSQGLPVVVLGGQHGDVPLERTGGRLIADLVVEEPGYYVIDFSLFDSGESERQFAVDFAERLYRAKGQPGRDFTLHLFVDEADRFIPQQMRKGSGETSPRLLGAFETIVRRGGLRGLGTTLISQRAAVVNKNVLEMLDVLIALRTVGPNDQDAILNYIKRHGDEDVRDEMMGSLSSLEIGEAWVWEPGAEPTLFKRVHIRPRRTFNSSATPKPGETRVEPKRLADVDLAALNKRMAATIEKAKADDPRELRKQNAELIRELAKKEAVLAEIDVRTKRLEEKLANVGGTKRDAARAGKITELHQHLAQHRRALEAAMKILVKVKAIDFAIETDEDRKALEQAVAAAVKQVTGPIEKRVTGLATRVEGFKLAAKRAEEEITALLDEKIDLTVQVEKRDPYQVTPPPARERSARAAPRPAPNGPAGEDPRLVNAKGVKKHVLALLTALAQHPEGRTREQAIILAGYVPSGDISTAFAGLLDQQFVESQGSLLLITPAGLAFLGPFDPLPSGAALREHLLARLSSAERKILGSLFNTYAHPQTRAQVHEGAGLKPSGDTSSAFGKFLKLGWVVERDGGLVAADTFYEE